MKSRIIIKKGKNVAEKLKAGLSFAFSKAVQENKSISIIVVSKSIVKQNLSSLFGEDFVNKIEKTGKINIENKMIDVNIITLKTCDKIIANKIALYIYPTRKLLDILENNQNVTDEIVIPYLEADVKNYIEKWNL